MVEITKVDTTREKRKIIQELKVEKDIFVKAPHIKIPSYGTEESRNWKKAKL